MPTKPKTTQLGKLPPQYRFILNPYADERFTRCPDCDRPTKLRKVPLLIHVGKKHFIALNKTCRYCPDCDLLISHQDELEQQLEMLFARLDPSVIGSDYFVAGTVERPASRQGAKEPMSFEQSLELMHDFKEVLKIMVQRAGWYPAGN